MAQALLTGTPRAGRGSSGGGGGAAPPDLYEGEVVVASADSVTRSLHGAADPLDATSTHGFSQIGTLYITNYRFMFLSTEVLAARKVEDVLGQDDENTVALTSVCELRAFTRGTPPRSIPLSPTMSFEEIENLEILTKAFKRLCFGLQLTKRDCVKKLVLTALYHSVASTSMRVFAFDRVHEVAPRLLVPEPEMGNVFENHTRVLLAAEMERCGIHRDIRWAITHVNNDFRLCPSYPCLLVIPASCSDHDAAQASSLSQGRIPVWVWSHVTTLHWIARAAAPVSSTSNIRNSAQTLHHLCTHVGRGDSTHWNESVLRTEWPQHVLAVLHTSTHVATLLSRERRNVLIVGDGTGDTDALVSSIAQVLLDPLYRTLAGLCALIKKDWLSMGHAFSSRLGHTAASVESQRSHVFLLFLDTLTHVIAQFPTCFEYTEAFLRSLWQHAISCFFGTFVLNCDKERSQSLAYATAPSLWKHIRELSQSQLVDAGYLNILYTPTPDTLYPDTRQSSYRFWSNMYLRWTPDKAPSPSAFLSVHTRLITSRLRSLLDTNTALASALASRSQASEQRTCKAKEFIEKGLVPEYVLKLPKATVSLPASVISRTDRFANRTSVLLDGPEAGERGAVPVRIPAKSDRIQEIARSSAEKARSALRASKDFAAELQQQEEDQTSREPAQQQQQKQQQEARKSRDVDKDLAAVPSRQEATFSGDALRLHRGSPLGHAASRASPLGDQTATSPTVQAKAASAASLQVASTSAAAPSRGAGDGGSHRASLESASSDRSSVPQPQTTTLRPQSQGDRATAQLQPLTAAETVERSRMSGSPLPPQTADLVYFNKRTVTLPKGSLGLGITLVGGTVDSQTGETAICIKDIKAGSAADRDGRVQVKDRVFSVNGQSVQGKTYKDVVEMIKSAQAEVTLELASWKRLGAEQSHGHDSKVSSSPSPSPHKLPTESIAVARLASDSSLSGKESPEKEPPEPKSKLFSFAKGGGGGGGGMSKKKGEDIHNIWARKAALEDAGLLGTDSENGSEAEDNERGSRRGDRGSGAFDDSEGVWPRPLVARTINPERRLSAQALIEKARRDMEEQETREREELELRRREEEAWLEEREARFDARTAKGSPARESEATERARREAEEKEKERKKEKERAQREVEEKEREKAKREAEEKEKEKERAQREAEAKERAQRVVEEKERAQRVAEEKARREIEEKVRRDAEEKARREAADTAEVEKERKQLEAEQEASARRQRERSKPRQPVFDSSSSSDEDEYVTPIV